MLEIPWRRAVARCGLRGSDGIQGAANFCGAGGLTAAFRAGDGLADIFSSPRRRSKIRNGRRWRKSVQKIAKNASWKTRRDAESYALVGARCLRRGTVTETPD